MNPIDNKQKALINIMKAQLLDKGVFESEGAYREHLQEHYNSASIRTMTYAQATAFIEAMKAMGGVIVSKRRARRPTAPNMTQLVSPQELAKVEHLKHDVIWRHVNGYKGLVKKIIGKEAIATSKDASKVIEALKSMVRRQQPTPQRAEKAEEVF